MLYYKHNKEGANIMMFIWYQNSNTDHAVESVYWAKNIDQCIEKLEEQNIYPDRIEDIFGNQYRIEYQ